MKRRAILGELLVFLGLRYGILLSDRAGWVPPWMHLLPPTGLSWLYFLLVVILVAWRRARGESWSQLGFPDATRWCSAVAPAIAGVVAAIALDALTSPLLQAAFGSAQDLSSFRSLVGSFSTLTLLFPAAWVFAALGEEVFYRGWLMSRLEALFAAGTAGRWLALMAQSIVFGAAHLYQGPGGAISTSLYGLVYGYLVIRNHGSLAAAILMHGLVDTMGLIAIYTGAMPTG